MSDNNWTPEWARDVVWYQVFPERFRNGDAGNDPTLEDIRGAWPHDMDSPWEIHPWTSDWYELQPYEKSNGRDIWYNIQRRRYGGDIQGILDKLDYLEDLGITAIYLNPIFESPSHHKYDGATYHHIDPTFGPDPAGDREMIKQENPADPATWVWTSADKLILRLIDECHRRGMRIIFDGVFNHMGLNSWAWRDIVEKQQQSPYSDWFAITSWDDPEKGTKFDYHGWFGCKELPELREDENGIVAGPRDYIFAATRRWMDPDGDGDPSDGIDGWRLDVAFCVKHPFWKAWRKHVKSINPEAYVTAEVVEPEEKLRPYLEGDEFDAVMNYNFGFASDEYFCNTEQPVSTTELDQRLAELRAAFDLCVAYVQQNLFDSHDTARLASHIVNRGRPAYRNWDVYHPASKKQHTRDYDTRKPNADDKQIWKLFVIFQMTYLGAPMVYYGDEVGMWGANDPCCRKPMLWDDLQYDPEQYLADGTKRDQPDPVAPDMDLYGHYKKLIHIRNEHPALRRGDFETLLTDDERRVYTFRRSVPGEEAIVILNSSDREQDIELSAPGNGEYVDVLNGGEAVNLSSGKVIIPARWGRILVRK